MLALAGKCLTLSCFACFVLLHQQTLTAQNAKLDHDKLISKIAFGSCAKQDRPQPIWDSIVKDKPDLFLLIGDNIYGDSQDVEILKKKWKMLADKPGYKKLKATCPILATWDDHDYGVNDGGAEFPIKVQSQKLFLDFFDVPKDSPRRKSPGVYGSMFFGPADKRIQVILLDTRYFRSPLVKSKIKNGGPKRNKRIGIHGMYAENNDKSSTILGEVQWKWLENELKKPTRLRIIASSIQVIPNDHWWEKWGNFPHERKRLFDLIAKTKAKGVVFISGDRHSAEVSKLEGDWGYPIFDITSSSLNQPHVWRNEINKYRVGSIYHDVNYGMISIDWSENPPALDFNIRDLKGQTMISVPVSLGELQKK